MCGGFFLVRVAYPCVACNPQAHLTHKGLYLKNWRNWAIIGQLVLRFLNCPALSASISASAPWYPAAWSKATRSSRGSSSPWKLLKVGQGIRLPRALEGPRKQALKGPWRPKTMPWCLSNLNHKIQNRCLICYSSFNGKF